MQIARGRFLKGRIKLDNIKIFNQNFGKENHPVYRGYQFTAILGSVNVWDSCG